MRLFNLVLLRISVAMVVIFALWAVLFYMAVMEEVVDEVDDSLEDYAEALIIHSLSGEEMPASSTNTNNQYYFRQVSKEYADTHKHITYRDEIVFIKDKGEDEPARVLAYIYKDDSGQHYELVVYTPTIERSDLLKAIAGWIVFLYLVLLLAIIIINVWVVKREMRPLYKLLNWLDRYRPGRETSPLDNPTNIYEFKRLNQSLQSSVERSENLFEQQKLFIGNASHEMQTPLAICQNRIEMMMDDDSVTESQMGELLKISGTLKSLSKLNRTLLLLCKIDNGQFADTRLVSLNEMFGRYLGDYKEVYGYKEISVSVSERGTFRIDISETLAYVMVTNLLKNAFVHTDTGGEISVKITENTFEVSNSGTTSLDTAHVFERFYQSKRKEGSTGLGLALVESICKLSKLNISYDFSQGMHHFRVTR